MRPGENLVLVDGSSLAFRAFFALFKSGLRRADGTPTWAIYGFFNSLFDLIERKRPDGMAMAFDLSGPTFRDEKYAEYKANRSAMPDDLSVQWPVIKQGVKLLGIPLYEIEGYEADDVIGTVSKDAEAKGIQVQIFTGDKDAFQLVDNVSRTIKVLMPGRPGKGEILEYGRQEVFEKLGVWPEQVIDYKGLCGDTSDNIPGVKGIGPKTAVQLLSSYQTIEGIYEHLDEIKSQSVRQKLTDGKESAFASKDLATIRLDVPLQFDFEHCQLTTPSQEAVAAFFTSLEFKNLVGRLSKILSRFDAVSVLEGTGISPQAEDAPSLPSSVPDFSQKFSKRGGGTTATSVAVATPAAATAVVTPPITLAEFEEPLMVSSEAALKALMSELQQQTAIAMELETSGPASLDSEIVGYSFAWAPHAFIVEDHELHMAPEYKTEDWKVKTAYVPVQHATSIHAEALTPELILSELKPILEDRNIGKIMQNAKQKLNTLSLHRVTIDPVVFDPVLASYLVNPDEKHLLKDQAERILGYKTVRANETTGVSKKQLTINFSSIDKVASCSADDARITLELTRYYAEKLDVDQRYLLYDMELPLTQVLADMEQNGIGLDLTYLAGLSQELTQELNRLEKEIYELAGHTFNINSTQQLQKVLFEELGLKSKGTTKTGFSTDASVLEALKGDHEIVARILEYRQLSKLRSTYVDALPPQVLARSNRVHGEFNQFTTATGRLSSSNPNLQNIPIRSEIGRRIRRSFVSNDPSKVIVSADYSQIELRLVAHMSRDETLIDAFEKNQDIHARTAGEIFEIPIEQVTAEQRRIGKTLNFALLYQQGAYATAQDLGISNKEAQAFIDKYFARYPKIRGFLNRTIEEARATNYVSTLWGRKRYFRFLNDRSDPVRKADERAACNAPLQGSAADLMKLAMIRLRKQLKERNLNAKLILQVHDELVLEVPRSELDETKDVIMDAMQMDQPFKVPLKVDVGVGENWMDAK
ncbi:MAG TPA: DNA polymerase I [Oculatellaceae cyanobacterium]